MGGRTAPATTPSFEPRPTEPSAAAMAMMPSEALALAMAFVMATALPLATSFAPMLASRAWLLGAPIIAPQRPEPARARARKAPTSPFEVAPPVGAKEVLLRGAPSA